MWFVHTDMVEATMSNDKLVSQPERPIANSPSSESSEQSSLWKTAYEHPGYVVAGVAAAAVGVGVALATRGLAAEISPFVAKNILLVEDGPYGAALEATLKENRSFLSWLTGPNVTRVSGISSLEPFTATTTDGASMVLDPSKFNVALVNGNSMPGAVDAGALAGKLRDNNVTTIATSLTKDMNNEMVANGAALAVQKGTVLPALMDGTLDLRTAVINPERVQVDVSRLSERLLDRSDLLRKRAGDRLKEFLPS